MFVNKMTPNFSPNFDYYFLMQNSCQHSQVIFLHKYTFKVSHWNLYYVTSVYGVILTKKCNFKVFWANIGSFWPFLAILGHVGHLFAHCNPYMCLFSYRFVLQHPFSIRMQYIMVIPPIMPSNFEKMANFQPFLAILGACGPVFFGH